MISDWKESALTDYLLGEMPTAERAAFEAELQKNASLKEENDALAALLSPIAVALKDDQPLALTELQRQRILAAARERDVPARSFHLPIVGPLILASICVVLMLSIGKVTVVKKFKESKVQGAKIQIAQFSEALQAYYLAHKVYPHTSQGLRALVQKPTVGKVPENYPEGGYLNRKELPKDPWGHDYIYVCDDYRNFTISSAGPDGEPGTADDIKSD